MESESPEPAPHRFRAAGVEESDEVRCVDCDAGIDMADIACPTPGIVRARVISTSPDWKRFVNGEISSQDYARRLVNPADNPEVEPESDWRIPER
jgi:hypothetical protein